MTCSAIGLRSLDLELLHSQELTISADHKPFSISPDDGKVFIEVATRADEQGSDISTWREIWLAARNIIQTCGAHGVSRGGMVTDIGKSSIIVLRQGLEYIMFG